MKTLKAFGIAALVAASATAASAGQYYSDDDARSALSGINAFAYQSDEATTRSSFQPQYNVVTTDTTSPAVRYNDDDARAALNSADSFVLPEAK